MRSVIVVLFSSIAIKLHIGNFVSFIQMADNGPPNVFEFW